VRGLFANQVEKFQDWRHEPEAISPKDEVGGAAARMYRKYLEWTRKAGKKEDEKLTFLFRKKDGINFKNGVASRVELALKRRLEGSTEKKCDPRFDLRKLKGKRGVQIGNRKYLEREEIIEAVVSRLKEETEVKKGRMTFVNKAEAMNWVRRWTRSTDSSQESGKLIEAVVDALVAQESIVLRQKAPETSSRPS
jgi:hypothetical protein